MRDSVKLTVTSEPMAIQAHRDIVAMMKDHGYVTVEIKAGTRTLSQNALYWIWVRQITQFWNETVPPESRVCIETGEIIDFDEDYTHARLRKRFLGEDNPITVGGITIAGQLKSTAKLTKHEMMDYMTQIEVYAANAGIELTMPADSQYWKLKQAHEIGE